jgi:ribonuclease Z
MSMRVTFLGTSGAVPTTERNPSSILVNREGDRLLFDAGEGTQRQMMRFGTGFTVSDLFITHLHGDHIDALVHTAGHQPSFPIHITEVAPGEVAVRRDEYEVRAFRTDHDANSLGYTLVEDERKGRFDREQAEELGVPVGPKFQQLHSGNPVELDDGTVVRPEQVVGEPRPGRRFVYTGDTRPTEQVVSAAENADLLVHDATFADDRKDRAKKTAHSTARQAANVARRAGAARLAITHVSSRYAGNVSAHLKEAREEFDGEVFAPDDGDLVDVRFPDE